MLRFLDARGFEHTPRLLGWYGYAGPRLAATLGILQEFVPARATAGRTRWTPSPTPRRSSRGCGGWAR